MMRSVFAILVVLILIAIGADSAIATPGWHIRDTGKGVELVSPQASWPIIGSLNPPGKDSYYVEIPLHELLPPSPTPTAQPVANNPSDFDWDEEIIEESSEKPSEPESKSPPKVIVEYDDSDRFVLEANKLFNKGKYYEATKVVEELLRKNPTHLRAWVMKGSLMHVQGQRDLAKSAWDQALQLDPENVALKKMLEKYNK